MHLIYRNACLPRTLAGVIGFLLFFFGAAGLLKPHAARAAEANAGQQVMLPYSFRDNFGGQWDVQQDGSVGPGNADVFDAGGKLFVGANQPYAPSAATVGLDAARNELSFGAESLAGLNVSRRVGVDVKEGWCRWIEVLENPTATPIRTQVHVNFKLGATVQTNQSIVDEIKTHKPIGMAIFDGNRGIATLGAGRGAKVMPAMTSQQNSDQIDLTWDVEVPGRRTIAIIHLQAVRPTAAEAQSFLEKVSEAQILHDLSAGILKGVVNFAAKVSTFGDLEFLRGDLLDIVELRGGDQYKGAIQDKSFALQTPYGLVELPAEKVLAMFSVGDFHPTQLLVTRAGEAFGGVLRAPVLHLQLSSGQITLIPINTITRFGYRKGVAEPEEFRYDHPMLILRNGDRIAVEIPADSIPAATRYGNLLLKPEAVGALIFAGEEQPVHEVLMNDGSRIAALIGKEAMELRPLSIGAIKPISFSTASVSRLQLSSAIDEPTDQTAMMSLSTGDRLVGSLGGTMELETTFDTIAINGAEVRGIHHAGSAPGEVQITLWDDATLSGRLKGDIVDITLKSGPTLHVPAALIEQYSQPQPQPPASIREKIQGMVADLGSDDWKCADCAAASLGAMGAKITSALKSMRSHQDKAVQDRIDKIVTALEPPAKAPDAVPATNQ